MSGKIMSAAAGAISKVAETAINERARIGAALKAIVRYPIKTLAAYIASPILVAKVALSADVSLTRRVVAVVGLVLAALLAYLAGGFLGTVAGALLVYSTFGILTAIAFVVGAAVSVYITVTVMAVTFNTICFLVLKMNRQDVIDYLQDQIKSDPKKDQ